LLQQTEEAASMDANHTSLEADESLEDLIDNISAGRQLSTCDGETNLHAKWFTYIRPKTPALPVVLSAPHDGWKSPHYMSNRVNRRRCGGKDVVTVRDAESRNIAKLVRNMLGCILRGGSKPFYLQNNVDRKKIDLNRDMDQATCGNPCAKHVWKEFMKSGEDAKTKVERMGGGLWLDFHARAGQTLPNTIQLGYALNKTDIIKPRDSMISKSTLKNVARQSSWSFRKIVRGKQSLGGRLRRFGIFAVPRPGKPKVSPRDVIADYFTGGHIIRRFGKSGKVDAVQVELPPGIRCHTCSDSKKKRKHQDFAFAMANVIVDFLRAGKYKVEKSRLIKKLKSSRSKCLRKCTTRGCS